MMKFGALFSLLVLACAMLAGEAHAAIDPATMAGTCQGSLSATSFISPLVNCFANPTSGIIPLVTLAFIAQAKAYFVPIVGLAFVCAIALYGLKLMNGEVRRVTGETIVLGLKIAGVFYFLNNAGPIYTSMVGIITSLSDQISKAATSLHGSGFCNNGGVTAGANNLWQRWDCVFSYIFGLGSGGFAIGSLAAFLFLLFMSAGSGIVVFFVAIYLIIALFFAAARFIHIFLMAVLALSFMFCLGYIFVPTLLFRNSYVYFQKWLIIVLSYILTPVIMFGYMGMMLVALDVALFSGQYSICMMVSGSVCSSGAPTTVFQDQVYQDATGTYNSSNVQDNFKELGWVGENNNTDPATLVTQNGGVLGFIADEGEDATTFEGKAHATGTLAQVGFDQKGLTMGGGQIANIFSSFAVAGLLAYIMYSLLSYIPSLASDLVAQGTTGAARIVKAQVFGEAAVRGTLETAKESAIGAAKGAATGGYAGAITGAATGAARGVAAQMSAER